VHCLILTLVSKGLDKLVKLEKNERHLASSLLFSRFLIITSVLFNAQTSFSAPADAQEEAASIPSSVSQSSVKPAKVTRTADTPAQTDTDAEDDSTEGKTAAEPAAPNVGAQMHTASQLMVDGKYPEAVEVFKQIIVIAPNNVEALAGMGMALGRQQKLDEADAQFNRVLEIDANNAVAHCGKAMTSLNRLQATSESDKKQRTALLKQAGRECNKALDADPRVVEAHYLLGKVYREEGRLDRAEQAFGGACKLDPKYANAWAYLGFVQVQQGKYSVGEENLRRAIAISANNSTAYFGLGQMYAKQGQFDKAVREYGMAVYKNPNNDAIHIAYGQAEQQLGESVAAQREFQEAIRLRPDNPEGYLSLAANFMAHGDVLNAVVKLKQGLQAIPADVPLHLAIADANIRLGKITQAIADYELVLMATPSSSEAARGLARAFYVRSLRESTGGFLRADDYVKAKDLLNKAVAANPANLQIRYAQAALLALSGQAPSLSPMGVPTTIEERAALAEALLALNNFKESDEQLRRAINESVDPAQVFNIADNALASSDLELAEAAYRRALSFPSSDTRGRQGLEVVARARQDGKSAFNQAQDFLQRRNFLPASEKFHDAIYGDPRNPDARLGLAQSLEKLTFSLPNDNARNFREASHNYRLYILLTPSMPVSVTEKFMRKVAKLDEQASKFDGLIPTKTASDRNSLR
jgi:tetratricopeptide (TPR) repeat protein